MCERERTGTIQDVIHCQGRAGVTGGDLRSPVRHQVMLIRRLQLQAVLDPPRSAESYTWLERVCPFLLWRQPAFQLLRTKKAEMKGGGSDERRTARLYLLNS